MTRLATDAALSIGKYDEEIFMQDGSLVDMEEWVRRIDSIRLVMPNAAPKTADSEELEILKDEWKKAFENAILMRAKSVKGKIGVLFSGGVDSTFIAHILHLNKIPFTCITVGYKDVKTKDPEDLIEAQKIAEHYGWDIIVCSANAPKAEEIIHKTILILKEYSMPVTVGVGAVVLAGCMTAKEHGITALFAGLGSEEIFAGYRRHERSIDKNNDSAVHDECWRGLVRMRDRDLVRDTRISSEEGITILTPFLDPNVIISAMKIPTDEKIKGTEKKYVLRAMAKELGMPHEYAFRPKRAAQYGSRFDSVLDRLGHDRKCDYIEGILGYKPII